MPTIVNEPAHVNKEEERKETEAQGGKELLYRKIHDKLSDKTELYKLHLKHYHMSPAQFRHRTSELHLSPKIYELYEQVVTADPWSDGEPAEKLVELRRELLGSPSS